ncbi:MAG: EamA family transporter [Elusimicrobia bacterium]|nr:EamA family transporter [Elusimicrobiota bacterium]
MSPAWADFGLVYCAAVWGVTFYMVKDALAGVDPVAMVAHRFLLSALLLAPWALARPSRGRHLKEAFILSILLFFLYATQTVGLAYTTASNSGFITGLFVIFVPVCLFLFFRKPPTAVQWASSALALIGLWMLTGGVSSVNFGDAITIVAAAAYAGHLLATDKFMRADADAAVLAFHQFWMTGAMAAAYCILAGRPLSVVGSKAAGTIAFLAAIPTVSAFFIQMWAQKLTAPVKVSLIFSLEPVFAALFAWTLGGEAFVPARAAGGGLIVAAMTAGELGAWLRRRRVVGSDPLQAQGREAPL